VNYPNFYKFFFLNKGEDRRGILPILPKINGDWYNKVDRGILNPVNTKYPDKPGSTLHL